MGNIFCKETSPYSYSKLIFLIKYFIKNKK